MTGARFACNPVMSSRSFSVLPARSPSICNTSSSEMWLRCTFDGSYGSRWSLMAMRLVAVPPTPTRSSGAAHCCWARPIASDIIWAAILWAPSISSADGWSDDRLNRSVKRLQPSSTDSTKLMSSCCPPSCCPAYWSTDWASDWPALWPAPWTTGWPASVPTTSSVEPPPLSATRMRWFSKSWETPRNVSAPSISPGIIMGSSPSEARPIPRSGAFSASRAALVSVHTTASALSFLAWST